jgi:hypothetical protein
VAGRRRPTHVGEDEKRDILSLRGAGYSFSRIAETLNRSEATVRRILQDSVASFRDAALAETQLEPATRGDQYLQWHAQATAVAASNGDAKPAMDMLDRLGMVPETSRDRTLLAIQREKNHGQAAVASAWGGGRVNGPTVNIGFSLPSQLMPAVSEPTSGPVTRLLPASENQRLTAIGDEVGEIPSSQPTATVGTVRG